MSLLFLSTLDCGLDSGRQACVTALLPTMPPREPRSVILTSRMRPSSSSSFQRALIIVLSAFSQYPQGSYHPPGRARKMNYTF